MSKLDEMIETIERLFETGADEDHDADDMLDLLDGIDPRMLLDVLMEGFHNLYGYTLDGETAYRGKPITEHQAVRIYEDPISRTVTPKGVYEHSLELWLLSDMSLLITSCFRTTITGRLFSEYRTVKGTFWRDTDMIIDFEELADNLACFCDAFDRDDIPVHEL